MTLRLRSAVLLVRMWKPCEVKAEVRFSVGRTFEFFDFPECNKTQRSTPFPTLTANMKARIPTRRTLAYARNARPSRRHDSARNENDAA
jgi:hypothetical protein